MKLNLLKVLLLAFILFGCKKQEKINVTEPYEDTIILVGPANLEGFQQEPFMEWYNENFNTYVVNDSLSNVIKSNINTIKIKTFMGTWCEDSQRETPNFVKILDAIEYDPNNHEIITVNREKTTPQGLEQGLNITNVPTFIFYKNGKEINRIVEFPLESLEEDMVKILTNQEYKHAYYDVDLDSESE